MGTAPPTTGVRTPWYLTLGTDWAVVGVLRTTGRLLAW